MTQTYSVGVALTYSARDDNHTSAVDVVCASPHGLVRRADEEIATHLLCTPFVLDGPILCGSTRVRYTIR